MKEGGDVAVAIVDVGNDGGKPEDADANKIVLNKVHDSSSAGARSAGRTDSPEGFPVISWGLDGG